VHATFTQLEHELTAALFGLDAAQTQLRPLRHPGKWTVQQIATHLLLAYDQTSNAIEARLAKGHPTLAKPTLSQYAGQFLVLGIGFLPTGRAAPEAVLPPAGEVQRDGDELGALAKEKLVHLDRLAREAETLFGKTRCITHMALGPLSIPQWRRFQLVHTRHHLKQVRAILRERHA